MNNISLQIKLVANALSRITKDDYPLSILFDLLERFGHKIFDAI